MSQKLRRMRVGVFHCEVTCYWADSQLKFIDSRGAERKEVWIHIERPSDVDYIREQLNKIVDGWQKQLAAMSN